MKKAINKKLFKRRVTPKKKLAKTNAAPKKGEVKTAENECISEKGGGKNCGRTQGPGSREKPKRRYGIIPVGETGSADGRAIWRFAGIVQRPRCGFGECGRVA